MNKIGLLILCALILGGCAIKGNYDKYADNPEFLTHPKDILVTKEDIVDRPYEVLADIKGTGSKATIFSADPTPEDVNRKLLDQASRLGADAIILVRYGSVGIGVMSWGELEGQGRAVKFIQ